MEETHQILIIQLHFKIFTFTFQIFDANQCNLLLIYQNVRLGIIRIVLF